MIEKLINDCRQIDFTNGNGTVEFRRFLSSCMMWVKKKRSDSAGDDRFIHFLYNLEGLYKEVDPGITEDRFNQVKEDTITLLSSLKRYMDESGLG